MATIEWMTGLESGTKTLFPWVDARKEYDVINTDSRSGSHCLAFNNIQEGVMLPRISETPYSELYMRFGFKCDFKSSGSSLASIIEWYNSDGSFNGSIGYTDSGRFRYNVQGLGLYPRAFGGMVTSNRWTCLEFYVKVSTDSNVGRFVLKQDGLIVIDFTGLTAGYTPLGGYFTPDIYTIYINNRSNSSGSFKIDDIAMSRDGWIGRGGIQAVLPVSDSSTQLTPSTGTDNYALVSEVPPDEDATYVSGTSGRDLYNFENVVPNSTINSVQWNARARTESTELSDTISSIIKINDIEYVTSVSFIDPNGTTIYYSSVPTTIPYRNYYNIMNVNPDTETTWEVSDLSNIVAGEKIN